MHWPAQDNALVGRQQELAEIGARISDPACRLLTLAGPGGIGKTRLAIAAAERHAGDFADGAFFVPFLGVESGTDLAGVVADALQLSFHGTQDPLRQLLERLRRQQVLLVMDNVEQLLDDAGKEPLLQLLTGLLHTSPASKLIVTSRTVLHIQEEWVFRVSGLQLMPDADAATSEAVALFVQRAQRTGVDLTTARERDAIALICRHVDGHPLALELAASWTDTLSCVDIAHEVEHAVDFLVSRHNNVPRHHASIEAVFEKSWARLDGDERAVLQRLAVFHGGCTLAAAKAVAGASLPVLAALIDRSLLRRTASGRYELHELLRQYAAEQLSTTPAEREQVMDRHAEYYLTLVSQMLPELQGRRQKEAVHELNADIQNIIGAWRRAVAKLNAALLMDATAGIIQFCDLSGRFQDGLALFRLATDRFRESSNVHCLAHLQIGEGMCQLRIGRLAEAVAILEQSVARLREIVEQPDISLPLALSWLGHVYFFQSRYGMAARTFQESVDLYRLIDDTWGEGLGFLCLGLTVTYQGDLNEAERCFAQSERLLRSLGEQRVFAFCLGGRGANARVQGDYARARRYLDEALTIRRDLDDLFGIGYSTRELGYVAMAQGDYAGAEEYMQESLDAFTAVGAIGGIVFPVDALGTILRVQGKYAQAEVHHQRALSISLDVHETRGEALARLNLGRLAMLTRDVTSAEEYLRTSLEIFSKIGYHVGVASASTVGGALLGTLPDRRVEAGEFFRQALELGSELDLTPVLLETFLEIAAIVLAELPPNHPHVADWGALLTFVRDHPASTHEMQRRAAQELDGAVPGATPTEALDLESALTRAREAIAGWVTEAPSPTADGTSSVAVTLPELMEPLTDRELDVLRLVDQGQSNREIAEALVLTLGTVKWYTNQIYSKLGVKNRSEATHVARRFGLLP